MKLIRISTVPESLHQHLRGQLNFLSNHFEVIGISSPGKFLDEVKDREHIKTISVQIKRKISIFNDIISLYKLFIVFKREKPTIVHSITPKAGLLSMLAAKFAKVPIRMHTFTGLIFPSKSGLMQKLLIQMDCLLCWAATNIYPEGQGVKNDLIKYTITNKPLTIIANGNVNGVDLEYFNPKHYADQDRSELKVKLGIKETDFVFVFVGRLVRDKGINELIQAFKELTYSQVKLILVGTFEPDLDPLHPDTVDEIENNPNIIAVGYQDDVRPYFSISNTLVFPSYREGFPNVVLQAGAMKLPSIVTNINGSNEIIVQGINGQIIPVKDIMALKSEMQFFIQNEAFVEKLSLNSRKLIRERFDRSVVCDALLKEYMNLIKSAKNV